MECHESLMQRRRKKSKGDRHRHKHPHHQSSNNTMLLDKSLPSLPPNAINPGVFSPDSESLASDGYSDTPTELPRISHKKPAKSRSSSDTPTEPLRVSQTMPPHSRSNSSKSSNLEKSPPTPEEDRKGKVWMIEVGMPETNAC